MEPNDGNGPGDERSGKKKRAPSARKRAPKATTSTEQNGATPTEREVAPQAQPKPAQTLPSQTQPNVADRSAVGARSSGQRTSGERTADLGNADGRNFGDRDADSAANVAADLKSWMDTRRDDHGSRGEVL